MWDDYRALRRLWWTPDETNINPDALVDNICERLRLLNMGWPGRIEDVKKYMENEL